MLYTGFYQIQRQLFQTSIARDPQAFLVYHWLEASKAFKPMSMRVNGSPRIIEKGGLLSSIRNVHRQTGMALNTIRRCLKTLKANGLISYESSKEGTMFTCQEKWKMSKAKVVQPVIQGGSTDEPGWSSRCTTLIRSRRKEENNTPRPFKNQAYQPHPIDLVVKETDPEGRVFVLERMRAGIGLPPSLAALLNRPCLKDERSEQMAKGVISYESRKC